MIAYKFFFTKQAAETLKRLIADVQEVSLLSAEKVRTRFFHKVHLIHHHPTQGSKKLELPGIDAHIRLAVVLHYKIYFTLEENRIIVMEILMDKDARANH
ncbi:MAG: type II toxin-antitoxin system RelE/ParE family toxin [Flavobacteriales bacterium]